MRVGFTGTRTGMTNKQEAAVWGALCGFDPTEGHHGGCKGGDEEFHFMCLELGIKTVIRWGHLPRWRADIKGTEEHPPTNTIVRNQRMVDAVEVLIAAPATVIWRPHSGTWATINYAKRVERKMLLVYPDGSLQDGSTWLK